METHIKQLESLLEKGSSTEFVDLLPWLRELTTTEIDPQEYMDNLVDIFLGNRQLKVVPIDNWGEDTLANDEPDISIFYLKYRENIDLNYQELLIDLFALMITDCTGCCNAIEYIRASKGGILCHCNQGQTYHS